MSSFAGKGALVVGAGRGIGRAIARRLCAQGAAVLLVARTAAEVEAAAAEAGANATALALDIAAPDAPARLCEAAERCCGSLDILVHSAGVIFQERIETASLDHLDLMYRMNLRAPYALTQAALPALKARSGQVLFVNSTSTRAANLAGRGGFVGFQHALKAVADSLRDEVNAEGIRVISIYPGTTATPRQEQLHRLAGKRYDPDRLLQPADVAEAACAALALPWTAEPTDVYIRGMLPPSRS